MNAGRELQLKALFESATGHCNAGRFEDAKRECLQLLQAAPQEAPAHGLMGTIESLTGHWPKAVRALRRAIELDPVTPAYQQNLIVAARRIDGLDDVVSVLEGAIAANPGSLNAYQILGMVHVERHDPAAGANVIRRALERAPSAGWLWGNLSLFSGLAARWSEALDQAGRAVAHEPKDVGAHERRAEALSMLGRIDDAIAEYDACLSLAAPGSKSHQMCSDVRADIMMLSALRSEEKGLVVSRAPAQSARTDGWEERAAALIRDQLGAMASRGPHVVLFHLDTDGKHPYFSLTRGIDKTFDYVAVLTASIRAAIASAPQASIVLITDETSQVDALAKHCRIVRLPMTADTIMFTRMRAYRALALSGVASGPLALLDTDVALLKDFSTLMDGGVDIALTYRSRPAFLHMPFNEGVIMARDGAAPVTAEFFNRSLTLYETLAEHPAVRQRYPFDIRIWRGGQLSLGAFTGWRSPQAGIETSSFDGIRCRFLPCDVYNYALQPTDTARLLATKWAVHFKGTSKKMMDQHLRALHRN